MVCFRETRGVGWRYVKGYVVHQTERLVSQGELSSGSSRILEPAICRSHYRHEIRSHNVSFL